MAKAPEDDRLDSTLLPLALPSPPDLNLRFARSIAMRTGSITISLSIAALAAWALPSEGLESDEDRGSRVQRDLLDQVGFCLKAGVVPVTVVMEMEGIDVVDGGEAAPGEDGITASGLGVVYVGEEELPPGTTVGLFRSLLVRRDVLFRWVDDGTLESGVWGEFWGHYSVEFTADGPENGTSWMALPVGDVGAGPDDPSWWRQGTISKDELDEALRAINAKALVDWRRLAASEDGSGRFLLFNAHMINEPSAASVGFDGSLLEEEEENVGHLAGSQCQQSEEDGNDIEYCGAAFAAITNKPVQPGDSLLWCYGETYERNYPVGRLCLNDDLRERLTEDEI